MDIDDTIVRSVGTKRIPIPNVIQHVRNLKIKERSYFVGVLAAQNTQSNQHKNLELQIVSKLFYLNQTSCLMTKKSILGNDLFVFIHRIVATKRWRIIEPAWKNEGNLSSLRPCASAVK